MIYIFIYCIHKTSRNTYMNAYFDFIVELSFQVYSLYFSYIIIFPVNYVEPIFVIQRNDTVAGNNNT